MIVSRIKKIAFIIVIMVTWGVFLTGCSGAKKSPFDKIKVSMTKEEVHKALGEPDYVSTSSYDVEDWYNIKAFGLTGELSVWYGREHIDHVYWTVKLNDDDHVDKHEKEVTAIVNYYNDKCGQPTLPNSYYPASTKYIWEDVVGTEYLLFLESHEIEIEMD